LKSIVTAKRDNGELGEIMASTPRTVWVGYLEAGEKSSLVVRDSKLDTGNPATIYLFNLKKGRILEYRREIVEAKLRDLDPEDRENQKHVLDAYAKARNGFTTRAALRRAALKAIKTTRRKSSSSEANLEDCSPLGDEEWQALLSAREGDITLSW
jgi:hypothetical protein